MSDNQAVRVAPRVTDKLRLQSIIRSMQINDLVPLKEWYKVLNDVGHEQIKEIYDSVTRISRGQKLSKRIRAVIAKRNGPKMAAQAEYIMQYEKWLKQTK